MSWVSLTFSRWNWIFPRWSSITGIILWWKVIVIVIYLKHFMAISLYSVVLRCCAMSRGPCTKSFWLFVPWLPNRMSSKPLVPHNGEWKRDVENDLIFQYLGPDQVIWADAQVAWIHFFSHSKVERLFNAIFTWQVANTHHFIAITRCYSITSFEAFTNRYILARATLRPFPWVLFVLRSMADYHHIMLHHKPQVRWESLVPKIKCWQCLANCHPSSPHLMSDGWGFTAYQADI